MKKIVYILEILVVVLMSVGFVLELIANGFSSANFSTLSTIILLGILFYENYKKDELILKLEQEKSN